MKIFDVYQHPASGYEVVKRGFSWPAFFLAWIWAFTRKLWSIGFACICLLVVLSIVIFDFESEIADLMSVLLSVAVGVFFGVKGNEWRRGALLRAAWEPVERINAKSADAALEKYVSSIRDGVGGAGRSGTH